MNSTKDLILASNSPRRKQLLESAGFTFEVRVKEVEEIFPQTIPAKEVAEFLAKLKNRANRDRGSQDEIILTADTTVVVDAEVLGKPNHADEAFGMLQKLAGRHHEVHTGVCISSNDKTLSFTVTTSVVMDSLTESELQYYIKSFRPFDKAGAYGIQEWIGLIGISSLTGSYSNVVGLPVREVYQCLTKDFGLSPVP